MDTMRIQCKFCEKFYEDEATNEAFPGLFLSLDGEQVPVCEHCFVESPSYGGGMGNLPDEALEKWEWHCRHCGVHVYPGQSECGDSHAVQCLGCGSCYAACGGCARCDD